MTGTENPIWNQVIYDMGNYKLYNIMGPPCTYDQLKNEYTFYAIKTEDHYEDLTKEAVRTIRGIVENYSLIKPQGEEIEPRDVYIVWRAFPEISETPSYNISWRMNIYAGSPYFKDGNLLLCTESEYNLTEAPQMYITVKEGM